MCTWTSCRTYIFQLLFCGVPGVAIIVLIDIGLNILSFALCIKEHMPGALSEQSFSLQESIYPYLDSCGRSRSGRPASTTFCLTQSVSHEGRMIFISPLFCNDATFTVPMTVSFARREEQRNILLSATQTV